MYRSNRNQVLQNYFDSKMIRTRENPYCIDAQLLNIAAIALDDSSLRYSREIKALQLPYCPTALDNNGVYYSLDLDQNYAIASDTTSLNSLVGILNGKSYELSVYNDLLPVPTGYVKNSLKESVRLDNPILTSFAGTSATTNLTQVVNQTLPIVNRLGFWLSNLDEPNPFVDVVVYGTKYPENSWNTQQADSSEVIQIINEGFVETVNAWVSISNIVVRNLPVGSQLDCYSIGFNLPASLDFVRPAAIPAMRDATFSKYWQVSVEDNLLTESYLLDNLSGLVYYQSYNLSQPVSTVAVEPNTWGGLLAGGTQLFYFDRRERMPSLENTGLSVEPCYGLDVFYDPSKPGSVRNVVIRPVPYKNSYLVSKYRLIVQTPDNQMIIIQQDGSYIPYSSGAGWISGTPHIVVMPLRLTGLYTITLECIDTTGETTFDVFPYNNFDMYDVVKGSFDLSSLIINIESIAYDFLGNLWLYDGLWAVPVKPYYNGYILDPVGRKIYLTDKWDQVTYS